MADAVAAEDIHVAALDFGGSKLVFAIVDQRGRIVLRADAPTDGRTPEQVVAWAAGEWQAAAKRLGVVGEKVVGVGATVPGLVDAAKQVLLNAPTHGWRDVPFGAALSAALSLPATIENDVNACALAEQRFAEGKNVADLLWVTVSTGIGGALLLRDELFAGGGAAGEIGHFIVEEGGPLCGCGHRGCLEAVAGGRALARSAKEQGLGNLDARQVFDLAASSWQAAAIIERATKAIGRALAFAVNLLDLEKIIIGGGVGLRLDLDALRRELSARILVPRQRAPQLVRTGLAGNAGVLGAAAIALNRLGGRPA
jgi:glucokinase